MKSRILPILLAGFLVSCATVAIDLPSLTDAPTTIRQPGRVVWHELLTNTPEQSRHFYAELFGWEFETPGSGFGVGGGGGYTIIRHNGHPIGGMIDTRVLNNREDVSQWIMVVSVDDVDGSAAWFERNGGSVLTPPTELANRGRLAVVADAEGAVLALLQTRDGDPPERAVEVGDFLWDELWSGDIDSAGRFYAVMADYTLDSESTQRDDQQNYRVLKKAGTARIGILSNPLEGLDPVWVNYLRVDDPAAITVRVEQLGGQVLIDARDRPVGGQAALIAGPSGAGIALQTWPLN